MPVPYWIYGPMAPSRQSEFGPIEKTLEYGIGTSKCPFTTLIRKKTTRVSLSFGRE